MQTERVGPQSSHWSASRYNKLSDAAALVLDRARVPGAAASRGMLPTELREAIIMLCTLAHAEQMTIERLIVTLKEKWAALPDIRRLPRGGDTDSALTCVITQCILDFYSPGRPADRPSPTSIDLMTTRGDSR